MTSYPPPGWPAGLVLAGAEVVGVALGVGVPAMLVVLLGLAAPGGRVDS